MVSDGNYPQYFNNATVVVAATGAGLTWDVAYHLHNREGDFFIIAVNDAVSRLPWADALYAADGAWWQHHRGVPDFGGMRWSVLDPSEPYRPEKIRTAEQYGINLLLPSEEVGFSHDRTRLALGRNSGFQAINLAMHFGAKRIVLVGFNMTGKHFFGDHPIPLRNTPAESFIRHYEAAAGTQGDVEILNATPGSALKCFPQIELKDAL